LTIEKSKGMMASLPLIRGPGKGLRGDARTYPASRFVSVPPTRCVWRGCRLERSCPEGRKL